MSIVLPKYYFSKVSDGDCSLGDAKHITVLDRMNNRNRLLDLFALNAKSIVTPIPSPEQNITVVDTCSQDRNSRPVAECLITQNPDLIVGVVVADCIPLLISDSQNTVVAAVHLSRENLKSEFLEFVINKVSDLTTGSLNAYLGPCLQKQSHALGEGYAADFIRNAACSERFVSEPIDGKCYFDYSSYVTERLKKNGLTIAFKSEADTLTDSSYFSARGRRLGQPHGQGLGIIAL